MELNYFFRDEKIFGDLINVCFLPMYHTYGQTLLVKTLVQQSPTIIMRQFEEEHYLQTIQEFRVRTIPEITDFYFTLLT